MRVVCVRASSSRESEHSQGTEMAQSSAATNQGAGKLKVNEPPEKRKKEMLRKMAQRRKHVKIGNELETKKIKTEAPVQR